MGDLGSGDPETLKRFMGAAVVELLRCTPSRTIGNITVFPSSDGLPRTLYDKSPQGHYQILIDPKGRGWASYVYQFSHELTHVLCNYELKNTGDKQWFEEALCETASLFVCKRVFNNLALTDDPIWKQYATETRLWLSEVQLEPARRLLPEYSFPAWYREKAAILRQEKATTDNSRVVSAYLLPLFEQDPSGWESLRWINTEKSDAVVPFDVYLANWKARCPEQHQAFVGRIEKLFSLVK